MRSTRRQRAPGQRSARAAGRRRLALRCHAVPGPPLHDPGGQRQSPRHSIRAAPTCWPTSCLAPAPRSTRSTCTKPDGASRYDRVLGGEGLFRSGFDPQTLDFGMRPLCQRPTRVSSTAASPARSRSIVRPTAASSKPPGAKARSAAARPRRLRLPGAGAPRLRPRQRFVAGSELYDESIECRRASSSINGSDRRLTSGHPRRHRATRELRRLCAAFLRRHPRPPDGEGRAPLQLRFRFTPAPDPLLGVTPRGSDDALDDLPGRSGARRWPSDQSHRRT